MQVNGDAPKWVSPHFGVSQCISMDLAADTDAAAADDAQCGYTLRDKSIAMLKNAFFRFLEIVIFHLSHLVEHDQENVFTWII